MQMVVFQLSAIQSLKHLGFFSKDKSLAGSTFGLSDQGQFHQQ